MSNIIILEGMSTSGKSIVQKYLKDYFQKQGNSVVAVDEKEGLNVLLDKENRSLSRSLNVLKNLITKYTSQNYDYIIFDRFHISHNGTLNSNFKDFSVIEELLQKNNSKIIYLHVEKNAIVSRMRKCLTTIRKNSDFENFFNKRVISNCNSTEEENKKIHDFYYSRIKQHLIDLKETKLKFLKVDVTNIFYENEYLDVYKDIIKFIQEK